MNKVNVVTDLDVEFRSKFSWWSKWIDIAVFTYNSEPHLAQMKVSRNNKKKFRSTSTNGLLYRQASAAQIGDLTQMSGKAVNE